MNNQHITFLQLWVAVLSLSNLQIVSLLMDEYRIRDIYESHNTDWKSNEYML
jgi:hypothetical protein